MRAGTPEGPLIPEPEEERLRTYFGWILVLAGAGCGDDDDRVRCPAGMELVEARCQPIDAGVDARADASGSQDTGTDTGVDTGPPPCEPACGANARCVDGRCTCETGFDDCNGSPTDGCESALDTVSDCGACGRACSFPNATAACVDGACTLAACNPGWGDCNGDPDDGCERALDTLEHCGACGAVCAPARATGTCTSGSCQIASCDAGYADCEGGASDGCESHLASSQAHCGACGNRCDETQRCVAGACRLRVTQITAGWRHSCARLADGTVRCWGWNAHGQLGTGTTTGSLRPVAVIERMGSSAPLRDVTAIVAGERHVCALLSDTTLRCWGENGRGQLGNGTNVGSSVPVPVVATTGSSAPLAGVTRVVAGSAHTCALLSDTTMRCWGYGFQGQLGRGSWSDSNVPTMVIAESGSATPLSGITSIAADLWHTCAALADGTARCWGYNGHGQIGNGTTSTPNAPVVVIGVTMAVAVTAGHDNACAIRSDGSAWCWGRNTGSMLGSVPSSSTPRAVPELTGIAALELGAAHSCFQRVGDSRLYCMGYDQFGVLGDGPPFSSWHPVAVSGLRQVESFVAAGEHACAVEAGGARCWGRNDFGQLGDGTTTDRESPVAVLDL